MAFDPAELNQTLAYLRTLQGVSGVGGDSASQGLGSANSALGIASGLEQGGTRGAVRTASNAAGLYGNLSGSKALAPYATGLNDIYGIYSGLQRGGVSGYGQAAGAGLQGAGLLAGNPALSTAGGYVMAPLAVYNAIKNWKSGDTGSDAMQGAAAGAAVGSVVPVIGTGIGALIGGGIGAISSAFGPGREDPENLNWNQYAQEYGKGNPLTGLTPSQDYQSLAGIFDSRGSAIPFYNQFGRMGEQKFTNAMTDQINQAIKQGKIKKDATPQQIYNSVVNPWISGMSPQGWQNTNTIEGAPEKAAIGNLLTNMIGQYQQGQQGQWTGIAGQQMQGVNPYGSTSELAPISGMGGKPGTNMSHLLAAKGGHMKHFDDGGDVSFGQQYDPSWDSYLQASLDQSMAQTEQQATQDALAGMQQQQASNPYTYNDPLGLANYTGNLGPSAGQGSSNSGFLSPLLSHLGSVGQALGNSSSAQQAGGLAALLGLLGHSNTPAANWNPQPPPMFAGSNVHPGASQPGAGGNMWGNFSTTPRTALHPNVDYAHYGQGPEQSFFSNMAGQAPAQAPPAPQGSPLVLPPHIVPPRPRPGIRHIHAAGGPVQHFAWGGQPMPQQLMGPQPLTNTGQLGSQLGNGQSTGAAFQAQNPAGPAGGQGGLGNTMPGTPPIPLSPLTQLQGGPPAPHGPPMMPPGPPMGAPPNGQQHNMAPPGGPTGMLPPHMMTGTQGMPAFGQPGPMAPHPGFGFHPQFGMHPRMGRPGMMMRAEGGGAEGSPLQSGTAPHVHGPGDGTSDDINAKLSDGEFVMDAGSVSMLGNGSNEAGARKLEELRQRLRKHAGEKLIKGKQFMSAKEPNQYMNKGGKK